MEGASHTEPSLTALGSRGPAAPDQDEVPDLDTEEDRESGPYDWARCAA